MGGNDGCGLFCFAHNDKKELSLRRPPYPHYYYEGHHTHTVIARVVCNSWQSQYGNYHTQHIPSLREFVELVAISLLLTSYCEGRRPVAISLWGTISFTECFYFCFIFILFCLQIINSFSFLFWYLLLVVCGLLRRFTHSSQ